MSLNQNLVPIVIEKSGRTERAYDIYSRLLKDRIIFLGGTIDDATANLTIAQMLFLSNEDVKKDIHFYINSPGGAITAGLAIYDTMQFTLRGSDVLRRASGKYGGGIVGRRSCRQAVPAGQQPSSSSSAANLRAIDRTGYRPGNRSKRNITAACSPLRYIGPAYGPKHRESRKRL